MDESHGRSLERFAKCPDQHGGLVQRCVCQKNVVFATHGDPRAKDSGAVGHVNQVTRESDDLSDRMMTRVKVVFWDPMAPTISRNTDSSQSTMFWCASESALAVPALGAAGNLRLEQVVVGLCDQCLTPHLRHGVGGSCDVSHSLPSACLQNSLPSLTMNEPD